MKKMITYLKKRMEEAKKPILEKEILLGANPQKIKFFITFKELHDNLTHSCAKLFKSTVDFKSKLIVNGNLDDSLLFKIIKFAVKQHKQFTVIVNDGYQLSKQIDRKNSEQIAVIVETLG